MLPNVVETKHTDLYIYSFQLFTSRCLAQRHLHSLIHSSLPDSASLGFKPVPVQTQHGMSLGGSGVFQHSVRGN